MAVEEAAANSGVDRAVALDRFGTALGRQAGIGKRIALAGLAGQQRGPDIGVERARVRRQAGNENDGNAIDVGAEENAACEGKPVPGSRTAMAA